MSGPLEFTILGSGSSGGVLGMGNKLFALPWGALKVDADKKNLVLSVSKERLKDAPGFDKDHWPNFAETTFAESIRSYYA